VTGLGAGAGVRWPLVEPGQSNPSAGLGQGIWTFVR